MYKQVQCIRVARAVRLYLLPLFRIQDEVLACGGVQAVLGLSVLDDAQPYSREWSVLAVRNLTEGNER